MKKLLLVLMIVAMASFLFVGCLGDGIIDNGDGDDDGDDVVVPVTMTIEDEYKSTVGVTYVGCYKDVTVTFPEAVEVDYIVYLAQKVWNESTGKYEYYPDPMLAATPNTARTVWTYEDFCFGCATEGACEPICLVAFVKHPCCPGEEVALRVVTVDCEDPYADLAVTFKGDCIDPCVDPPVCPPFPVLGAYFEFSSRTAGECVTTDCCGDDCSGFASWTLVIDPDPCVPACDTVPGTACPVEGVVECGCLIYAAGGDEPTLTYDVTYTLLDNVGNKFEDTWTITVDTDEVITFDGGDLTSEPVTMGEALYVYTGYCVEGE